jgi:large subunit ribosomal protein L11
MDVVNKINEQTKGFAGLKVPVRIEIDTTNRTFEVVVETPMASALLLKEAGVTKGSAEPNTKFVGNLSMEQVISVAKMKLSALNAVTLKTQVKIILGTAQSCGITVEGTHVKETMQRVNAGEYDNLLGEA